MLYSTTTIAPDEVFRIGGFIVTQTMFTAFVATVALIVFALVIRLFLLPRWRKESKKKSAFRIFLEYLVNLFDVNSREKTGKNASFTGAFYFSLASFMAVGILLELLNLRPALTDFNLTLLLGLATFIVIFVLGFKERRLKRLGHYVNPLNILTDAVVPLSMALRMFGSVFSGYLIMELVYSMLPPGALVGLPAVLNVLFTLFHAVIQSYVYMFLSLSLINEAVEH